MWRNVGEDLQSLGTCVVIGVGPLLGFSVAQRFSRAGHPVALISRTQSSLEEFGAKLGADAAWGAYQADAADSTQIDAAIRKARRALGPIQVLVYNAAVLGLRAWPTELSHDLLLSTFEANVGSALVAAQAVVADMRNNRRGTILFTSGSWGFTPSGEYCSVGLGKAALYSLGLSLAEELVGDGIHVATITISGRIRSASDYAYDPDLLAEHYWAIHRQARPDWQADVRY
jgi:NAD(P)-dependent dehydrogenase (short-subunit alcohol dehydrogenase family)